MNLNKNFVYMGIFFSLFIIWTIAIQCIDVQAIGPFNSTVGFATLNGFFHHLTGTHMLLYLITDWLGLVPVFIMFGFAILGLIQLIKRRSLLKVDKDILLLGVFYFILFAAYLLFEMFAINYRPVLIDGFLEVSYPSSTTLLVLCVMPTAIMQFNGRISNQKVKDVIKYVFIIFSVFMVIGRLISGVHWLSDIIGAILLSAALVMFYHSIDQCLNSKNI